MTGRGEAAYEVLRQVRPLHLQAARAVRRRAEGSNVTLAVRALLERLLEEGPQTVPQVAAWLDVSRQAVQTVVDDTRRLGYVELVENPAHRRSHLVVPTPSGRAAFRRLHADELDTLSEVAAEIDETELHACARVLEQLTKALAARDAPRRGDPASRSRPPGPLA